MSFENATFIKPNIPFHREDSFAPMFRKTFLISDRVGSAELNVCALGFGYIYINGKKVSEDLFAAPYGDYRKTLWYLSYDVKHLLCEGENVISVICGNGWYNENVQTVWKHDEAEWRDCPKVILELMVNEKNIINTDGSWKYSLNFPITYNELRSGEYFDSRLYDPQWNCVDYNDSDWKHVQIDTTEPKGVFRKCECEPIRECELYYPKKMYNISENKVLFDFGQNMSGYIRLRINQKSGDKIVMRYAEEIKEDMSLEYNGMTEPHYYLNARFQENEFICCGKEFVYTPMFTYHGFRYVEVSGIKNPSLNNVTAVFVHQDIRRCSQFKCSDGMLNALFDAGIMATWSNLFYEPTDCPTREKLGWLNDAQASAEQMLTNFEAEKLFTKWQQDIFDAMKEDGALPGVVPTSSYGYEWGNGPVSDGALFEIPYRIYLHTGNESLLKISYPYFKRYLKYLSKKKDSNGDIDFGLGDWAPPIEGTGIGPVFTNKILLIKFLKISKIAEEKLGIDIKETDEAIKKEIRDAKEKYLKENGECLIERQTAVAMMIEFGIYDELEPLKKQLKKLVENAEFHHDCGMVGIRYLYHALSRCGLSDYAFKIIKAKGFPSYQEWFNRNMTTLFEHWDSKTSKNHHMYSDVLTWMTKNILGIKQTDNSVAFKIVGISPAFIDELNYADGYIETISGKISVKWERIDMGIHLKIDTPPDVNLKYKGNLLSGGSYEFFEINE